MNAILTIIIVVALIWLVGNLLGGAIGLLIWLLAAGLSGYFASRIMGGDGIGTIGNILLGFAGGLVAPVILGLINMQGLRDFPFIGGLLASMFGAVVIIFVARFFNKSFGK